MQQDSANIWHIGRLATVLYVPLGTVFCHLGRLVPLFTSGPKQQLAVAGHVMAIIMRKKSHNGKLLWETNKNNMYFVVWLRTNLLRFFLVRHCLVTLLTYWPCNSWCVVLFPSLQRKYKQILLRKKVASTCTYSVCMCAGICVEG
jgi:hypothetical protein